MRVPDHAVLKSVTRLNLQRHINWSSIDGIGIDPKDDAEDGDEGLDQDTARRLQTCTQLLKYLPALRYLTLEISSMNLLIAPEDDNVWQRKPAEIIRRNIQSKHCFVANLCALSPASVLTQCLSYSRAWSWRLKKLSGSH